MTSPLITHKDGKRDKMVLSMELFVKSLVLLPKSALAIVSSYMSLDENILSSLVVQKEFMSTKQSAAQMSKYHQMDSPYTKKITGDISIHGNSSASSSSSSGTNTESYHSSIHMSDDEDEPDGRNVHEKHRNEDDDNNNESSAYKYMHHKGDPERIVPPTSKTNNSNPNDYNLSWRSSLVKCLDKCLGLHSFSLRLLIKPKKKATKTGQSQTVDISLCNSDFYCFSGDILKSAIGETSRDTLNGNMMKQRYNLALASILSYNPSEADADHGMKTISKKDLKTFKRILIGTEDEDGDENDASNSDKDSDNDRTSSSDSDSDNGEKNEGNERESLEEYYECKKTKQQIHFIKYETENITNFSKDVYVMEDQNLLESNVDRSFMFLACYVNTLATLNNLVQTLKYISPTDVDPDLFLKLKEMTNSKMTTTTTATKTTDSEKGLVMGDNVIREITSIQENPGGKSYDITTHLRKVRNSIGVWGSECLFMDFLGSLRQLNGENTTGYHNLEDIAREDESKNDYDEYMGIDKDMDAVSISPTLSPLQREQQQNAEELTNSNSVSAIQRQQEQEKEREEAKYVHLLKRLKGNISLMCEERNEYCAAVLNTMTLVYEELSKYTNKVARTYREYLESKKYARTSKIRKFHERVQDNDRARDLYFSAGGKTDRYTQKFQLLKHKQDQKRREEEEEEEEKGGIKGDEKIKTNEDVESHQYSWRYIGSKEYETKRKETEELRILINKLMDEEETIFFFEDSVNRNDNTNKPYVSHFTTSILQPFATVYDVFVENEETDVMNDVNNTNPIEDITEKVKNVNIHPVDPLNDSHTESNQSREYLKKLNMDIFRYVHHLDLKRSNPDQYFNVYCIQGVPEAVLYDEMTLLKWITLISQSQTEPTSKAFNNSKNLHLPSIYHMISCAWVAKSFVALGEYESVAQKYDKNIITEFLYNCANVPEQDDDNDDDNDGKQSDHEQE